MKWPAALTLIMALSASMLAAYLAFGNSGMARDRYRGSDIEAIWKDGARICKGRNPYSRIHREGMKIRKPPTYFPGFYLTVCGMSLYHYDTFKKFMGAWKRMNTILHISVALFFFALFYRRGQHLLAILMLLMWLFGRWGVFAWYSLQPNYIAILPLILSLAMRERAPRVSELLYGISLAMKQIAIFLLPLYLIWSLQRRTGSTWWKRVGTTVVCVLGIPALITGPFFFNDPSGVLLSLGYSAARVPGGGENRLLGAIPGASSILMWGSMGLIFLLAFQKKIKPLLAAFLVITCFTTFNHTFFTQYYVWSFALLTLSVWEFTEAPSEREETSIAVGT